MPTLWFSASPYDLLVTSGAVSWQEELVIFEVFTGGSEDEGIKANSR